MIIWIGLFVAFGIHRNAEYFIGFVVKPAPRRGIRAEASDKISHSVTILCPVDFTILFKDLWRMLHLELLLLWNGWIIF